MRQYNLPWLAWSFLAALLGLSALIAHAGDMKKRYEPHYANKVPSRPAWTAYFLHAKTGSSRINRESLEVEKNVFAAEK